MKVRNDVPEDVRIVPKPYLMFITELLHNPSRAKTLSFEESPRGKKEAEYGMRALQKLRLAWWKKGRFTTHMPAYRRVGNKVYIFMVDLKDAPLHWGGRAPEDLRQAAIKRRLALESNTQS